MRQIHSEVHIILFHFKWKLVSLACDFILRKEPTYELTWYLEDLDLLNTTYYSYLNMVIGINEIRTLHSFVL